MFSCGMAVYRRAAFVMMVAMVVACGPAFAQGEQTGKAEQDETAGKAEQAEKADASLPDGKSLVAKHLEAVGGVAAMRKHSSRYMKMKFSGMGSDGAMEMWMAAPGKFKMKQSIMGMEILLGYDGVVGWMINPMMGPMLMEGAQLDQMKEQADFYGDTKKLETYASYETLEKSDFEGKLCYKVKLTPKEEGGDPIYEYYDAETSLLAGRTMKVDQGMGPMEVTTVETEYKQFDDMKIATKMVQRAPSMGMEMVQTVEAVEFDKVPDSAFELPEEIKEMVKAAESDGEDGGDGDGGSPGGLDDD